MGIRHILSKAPLYVLCLAIYPSLAYFTWNIREIDARLVYRPLAASLFLSAGMFLLAYRMTKEWNKAGVLTAGIQIVFFAYGHLKNALDTLGWPAEKSIWHFFLLPFFILLLIWLATAVSRRSGVNQAAIQALNAIGLILIAGPLYTIFSRPSLPHLVTETTAAAPENAPYPDIYYIVLDGYSRQDTLEALGYDNSAFRDELESLGFYIASCSRSNYRGTLLSLSSTLNMNYIWRSVPNRGVGDKNIQPVYDSLLRNQVRKELEKLGYTTIAFETGYEWNEWRDADMYLHLYDNPFTTPRLQPFEYGFMQTTMLNPLIESGLFAKERFLVKYERVLFGFEQLPIIAQMPGPKFIFAHLIIPHAPFMFLPDGSVNPDWRYYSSPAGVGETEALEIEGYLNNVRFVDSHFPQALREILANNPTPPIIIVQGDHGLVAEGRKYNILNAYYLPGGGEEMLYPTVTPVNTFRIVFSRYLGKRYHLVNDISVDADIGNPYRRKSVQPFPAECP